MVNQQTILIAILFFVIISISKSSAHAAPDPDIVCLKDGIQVIQRAYASWKYLIYEKNTASCQSVDLSGTKGHYTLTGNDIKKINSTLSVIVSFTKRKLDTTKCITRSKTKYILTCNMNSGKSVKTVEIPKQKVNIEIVCESENKTMSFIELDLMTYQLGEYNHITINATEYDNSTIKECVIRDADSSNDENVRIYSLCDPDDPEIFRNITFNGSEIEAEMEGIGLPDVENFEIMCEVIGCRADCTQFDDQQKCK